MCIQNVEQFEGSYTFLLNITFICTHTKVLNDIDNAQVRLNVADFFSLRIVTLLILM